MNEALPHPKIERIENIVVQSNTATKATKTPPKAAAKAPTTSLQDELKKHSNDLQIKDSDIQKIISFVNQYKTKVAINNNLMKFFKNSEKVGKITKVLRPFLKDKK